MLHVLIMLFSSLAKKRASEREAAAAAAAPESECGSEFSAAQRNVIYFLGKMKMSVREDEICGAPRRCFGYDFAFRLRRLLLSSSARRIPKKALQEVKGLKALAER
jgi:hypothetical protein